MAGKNHLIDSFLQALEIEVSQVEGRPEVDTIYLGGGTPSQLPAQSMDHLLKLLDQRFALVAGGEFTMEANPEDLPGELVETISDSPINRISLGVQSFHPEKLKSLDRPHTEADIESALESCRNIVDRFSIDLIFAAPYDSLPIWQQDLEKGIHSGAGHVSTYELTFESGTRFGRALIKGQLSQKEEDLRAEFYELAIGQLSGHEFHQYEISSFAKAGHASRHNQVYWRGEPWLAFGPGASGLIGNVRYTNQPSVVRYIDQVLAGESAIHESEVLSHVDLATDRLTFGLRMIEGVDRHSFHGRFGFDPTQMIPQRLLDICIEQELLLLDPERVRLSSKGILIADHICSRILQHNNAGS